MNLTSSPIEAQEIGIQDEDQVQQPLSILSLFFPHSLRQV